jgi:hypothetical protein
MPGLKDIGITGSRISTPLLMKHWPISKERFDGKGYKYLITRTNIQSRSDRVHRGCIDQGIMKQKDIKSMLLF